MSSGKFDWQMPVTGNVLASCVHVQISRMSVCPDHKASKLRSNKRNHCPGATFVHDDHLGGTWIILFQVSFLNLSFLPRDEVVGVIRR